MQTTGPLGRTTRYRHDAWGRTVEVIDAKGGSKRLAWDEADRLMAYTDCSGQTTRYTYDGMGRPLTRIDTAGRSLAYHYDRAGRWQRYIYNAAGELTHLIEAGGSDAGPGKVTSSSAMP
nr:RHS repeat protein [Delftia acidovorans]